MCEGFCAVEPTFVGRLGELGILESALADARSARPRVVLVHGPAGVGKTSLVRRFLETVEGEHILRASGDEAETALPYGVVRQLLAELPGRLPDPLAALAAETGPSADPLTVGAALLEVLGGLQDEGPVVMMVDDIPWADTPSMRALVFALRRLRVDRVLALLSARDEALGSLPPGLDRLMAAEVGTDVALRGLSTPDLHQLAVNLGVAGLPAAALDRLALHTGGNPLHVRAMLSEVPLAALLGDDLPAPRSFSGFVLSRLAECPPDVEALVVAASVLGLRCPLGLATRVGDVRHPLAAVEAAGEAGLLEASPSPVVTQISFTHPLVRAAVYHDLGANRRAALHARAAALAEDEASTLRHRVAATAGEDGALAIEVDGFAHREAQRGAWAAAAAAYLAAARVSPARADRERRVIEAADAFVMAGDLAQAAVLAEDFGSFADTPRRSCALGQLALVRGQLTEAEWLLLGAWDRCDPAADPELAARVATHLSTVYVNRALGPQTVDCARRALHAAPDLIAGPAKPRWLLVVGLAASGEADEALALVDSLPLVPGPPDQERIDWLSGRGTVRMWTDDLAGARDDLATVVDACRRQGPFHTGVVARFYLSETAYRLGCWDEAVIHAELAVSAAEDADQAWMAAIVHAVAVFPLAGRGEWERAENHARIAAEAARALGPAADITWAAVARARLCLAGRDDEGAVAALAPLPELAAKGPAVDEPNIQPWRELYSEALVRLGRLDDAEAVLAELEVLAAHRGRHSSLAGAARVRGLLEAARGNGREAEAAFELGRHHAAQVEMPFERALLDDAYGRFLRRAGERRRARERLGCAQDAYARLGARPYLERIEREVAACGLTPARRSAARHVQLTPQELAVARLVATGMTNREVAAELVVSAKTVGYHLGNIFTKLGVSSRTQLAARFALGEV